MDHDEFSRPRPNWRVIVSWWPVGEETFCLGVLPLLRLCTCQWVALHGWQTGNMNWTSWIIKDQDMKLRWESGRRFERSWRGEIGSGYNKKNIVQKSQRMNFRRKRNIAGWISFYPQSFSLSSLCNHLSLFQQSSTQRTNRHFEGEFDKKKNI